MRKFLENKGWWSEEAEEEMKNRMKKEVLETFRRSEGLKRPRLEELFNDVYGGEMPWNLVSILLWLSFSAIC
jgi:2-oxoisovalerate dehydrogenase E1 component alpha subunit